MVLLNDEMCKAFNQYMHEQETKDTLFAGQPWTAWRDTSHLVDKVVDYVNKYSGETRKSIWLHIVEDHFMQYTRSEYLEAVTKAFKANLIDSPTTRPTKRLNDNCALVPRQP